MEKYLTIAAEKTMQGMTVEKLLREYLGLTKKQISRAKFRSNGIRKNNVQCRVTEKVSCGDEIKVCLETEETQSAQLISGEGAEAGLNILYEDEDVLAVNKPAGVLTHPSGVHYSDSLSNHVAAYFREKALSVCIRPVGRLDKETSGIVLFAKNQVAAQRLQEQREKGILQKQYLALVEGTLSVDQATEWHTIEFPIRKIGGHPLRMEAVKDNGSLKVDSEITGQDIEFTNCLRAVTHYQVRYSTEKWSVVSLKLDTGRTHQIRVHMQVFGHPLLGDSLYGTSQAGKNQCSIYRAALHAGNMTFRQPFGQELIVLEAPLPEDFYHILGNITV